jgi:beta-lactam-binding protein with PASTA domain
MYYQQSSARVFWIAFLTSLIVSGLVSFTFVYFGPVFLAQKSTTVEIPDVENLDLQKAEMILDERRLKLMVEDERFHPTTKKDRVIYQKPAAGQTAEKGSTVRIVLSKGPQETVEEETEIVVPSVIGFDVNQAKVFLAEKGLSVGMVERRESEEDKDVVLETVPEPGQKVTESVPIKLVVSSGGGEVVVPDLRGKSEYRARLLLEESELELGRKDYITSGEHAFDIVVRQSPQAGEKIGKGSKVDITVNREAR